MNTSDYDVRDYERLMGQVVVQPNGCWEPSTKPNKTGYARLMLRAQKVVLAHKFMYEWVNRCSVIPGGHVGHLCNNRRCVNPAHLLAQTPWENIHQCIRDGRNARGDRSGSRTKPETRPRGDQHWSRRMPERHARGDQVATKLTSENVREIRAMRAARAKLTEIMARFGIGNGYASQICSGRRGGGRL